MFLVTTANQKYWKTDEKILFLGEWCKTYDQKHIWSKLDHETLPSNWDEWEKLDQRYTYLENLYDKYLNSLASNLSDCHRENYPWPVVKLVYRSYLRQIPFY